MTEYVYIMRGGGYIKVGQSKDVYRRMNGLNKGTVPFPVSLVGFAMCAEDARNVEAFMQHIMPDRLQGEWFKDSGQPDDDLRELMHAAKTDLKMGRKMKIYDQQPLQAAIKIHEEGKRGDDVDPKAVAKIFDRSGAVHNWQESGKAPKTSSKGMSKSDAPMTPAKAKKIHKAKMLDRLKAMGK
jgi:hypothetical protein